MVFVGIITDDKSKKYINKILKDNIDNVCFQIVYITEKSIENMKNIRFDAICINKEISKIENLKDILINAKYIIINTDLNSNLNILSEINSIIITYGFNSKSTITMSSNTEDNVQICVQRNILNKKQDIEQQEISLKKYEQCDIYDIMLIIALLLIYNQDTIELLKF